MAARIGAELDAARQALDLAFAEWEAATRRRGDRRLSDDAPGRWRTLALLALAEVLGMSLWFSASAVSGQYRVLWGLSAAEAGWLTTVVQLGFVAGTAGAAMLNLADVLPSRWYFAGSALLGAAANFGARGRRRAIPTRWSSASSPACAWPASIRPP